MYLPEVRATSNFHQAVQMIHQVLFPGSTMLCAQIRVCTGWRYSFTRLAGVAGQCYERD
jgi:hypothetical protein